MGDILTDFVQYTCSCQCQLPRDIWDQILILSVCKSSIGHVRTVQYIMLKFQRNIVFNTIHWTTGDGAVVKASIFCCLESPSGCLKPLQLRTVLRVLLTMDVLYDYSITTGLPVLDIDEQLHSASHNHTYDAGVSLTPRVTSMYVNMFINLTH